VPGTRLAESSTQAAGIFRTQSVRKPETRSNLPSVTQQVSDQAGVCGNLAEEPHLSAKIKRERTGLDLPSSRNFRAPLHLSPLGQTSTCKTNRDMAGILALEVVGLQNWLSVRWVQEASDGFHGPKPSPPPCPCPQPASWGWGGSHLHCSSPPTPGVGV
jgi:hypothetical protein